MSGVGDVVEVTGTSNPQNLGNGITVWTETWDEWLADSKAGPVRTLPLLTATAVPDPSAPTAPGTVVPGVPGDMTTPDPGTTSPGPSATDPGTPSAPASPGPVTQQTAFSR
jgi:hypothetical protein